MKLKATMTLTYVYEVPDTKHKEVVIEAKRQLLIDAPDVLWDYADPKIHVKVEEVK